MELRSNCLSERGVAWPALSPGGDNLAFAQGSETVNIWRKDLSRPRSSPLSLISSRRENKPTRSTLPMENTSLLSRFVTAIVRYGSVMGTEQILLRLLTSTVRAPAHLTGRRIAPGSLLIPAATVRRRCTSLSSRICSRTNWSRLSLSRRSPVGPATAVGSTSFPALPMAKGFTGRRRREAMRYAFQPRRCFNHWEGPDGRTAIFADDLDAPTLKQVSVDEPGREFSVPSIPKVRDADLWTVDSQGIYFVPADAPLSINSLRFRHQENSQCRQSRSAVPALHRRVVGLIRPPLADICPD